MGPNERPSTTVKKIRIENKRNKLLIKIWLCESVGDALKFEAETILKHKPRLNSTGTYRTTLNDLRTSRRQITAKMVSKYKEKNRQFDPNNTKLCPKCGLVKKYDEFYQCLSRKSGIRSWCKTCNKSNNNANL